MLPISEAHRNPDNLSQNLGLLRVSKNSHRNGRQGMRLQDDGITLHRAPATGISVAHFHKVNRALELRTPCSLANLFLGFVHLHETARRKNGIHRKIFRSNIPIGVAGVRKLRQIRHGHNTPLLDGASQVRGFLERESGIEPRQHPHLSDIETKGIIPSIFRLYSFAAIYRREYRELLSFYGLELDGISADISFGRPQKSHVSEALSNVGQVRMPTRLDPGFSLQKTTDLGRAIEQWGIVPMSYLAQFADARYTYGYIGSEDFTMYPILPPGSFVQVDETKKKVSEGTWRS